MILSIGCRAGCHFVVGLVAGKSASLLPGNADIQRIFIIIFYLWQRKQQEIGRKNEK